MTNEQAKNEPACTQDGYCQTVTSRTRSIRLHDYLWDQIETLAASRDISTNAVVRHALRLYLSGQE
jgi:predicted DNA-binding ribbon-helix-helix protein